MYRHSSGICVATYLKQPTRAATRKHAMCHPYLVLLQMGFAVPSMLPCPRCALTAPFHPYPVTPKRRRAVSFSVALSINGLTRRPGVTRHLVSVKPGLSSNPERVSDDPAIRQKGCVITPPSMPSNVPPKARKDGIWSGLFLPLPARRQILPARNDVETR